MAFRAAGRLVDYQCDRMNLLVRGQTNVTSTMQSLGIDRFDLGQKLSLIGEIWESVSDEVERIPLSDAQKADVESRLKSFAANPSEAIPFEIVEAEALARLRK